MNITAIAAKNSEMILETACMPLMPTNFFAKLEE